MARRSAGAALPILVALGLGLGACAASRPSPAVGAAATAPVDEAAPLLRLPGDVTPQRYRLHLIVDPQAEGFRGEVEIEVDLARSRRWIWLHGRDLEIGAATLVEPAGSPLPLRIAVVGEEGVIRLDLPRVVGPGRATLRFTWRGRWGQLAGLYRVKSGDAWYVASQFETHDARRAFPGFDEPAFKTPFEVRLTVPRGAVAIANSRELERAVGADGREQVRFAPTAPLPTYLLFFAVGPYDVVTTTIPPSPQRPQPLVVRGVAARGRGVDLGFSLDFANRLLPWFEDYFATPFPYDKLDHIAVPDFAAGAMENAGAISYREQLFIAPPGKTGEAMRRYVAGTIAHELAHQWFGDLVTPEWWSEIWLNESFADWLGVSAIHALEPAWRVDLERVESSDEAMHADGRATARAIRKPLARMADVDEQFDSISYAKGAAVLAMFERSLGAAPFRDAIRRYVAAHAHRTGSTEALLDELGRGSGRDVAGEFATFLHQPGVPLVEARRICEPAGAYLALAQRGRSLPRGSTADPRGRWRFPVCVAYGARQQRHERCLTLEAEEGRLALPEGCPEWVMPNAGGAGYYAWSLAAEPLRDLRERGLSQLTTAEKLNLVHNLQGAHFAGAVTLQEALLALAPLSQDPDPDVAAAPLGLLEEVDGELLQGEAQRAFRATVGRLLRRRWERLTWQPRPGEDPREMILRARLAQLLIRLVGDPPATAEAARLGAAYLGLDDGRLHPDAVAGDLVGPAVLGALLRRGGAAFDALVAHYPEIPPAHHYAVLGALGSVEEPALAARVRKLWRDPRLGLRERFLPFLIQLSRRPTQAAAVDELVGDHEALLAAVEGGNPAFFSAAVGRLRDPATRRRVEKILQPHLARHPRLGAALPPSLERATLGAAWREHEAPLAAAAAAALARSLDGAP